VLHIIPDSAVEPKHLYLGSTKDVRGRTEYFRARGIPFDEVVAEDRTDARLLEVLRGLDLGIYTSALVELPLYPLSLRLLRKRQPRMKLLTRSINAGLYHHMHKVSAWTRHGASKGVASSLGYYAAAPKDGLAILRLDYLSAKNSDYLLSITSWESDNYWRFLAPPRKVKYLPYFLPEAYRKGPLRSSRQNRCVCLMSTSSEPNPFLQDAARAFTRLVRGLGGQLPDWEFLVTGDGMYGSIGLPGRLAFTGLVESPTALLAESRAMALLSDYGFGFKTKVLDAAAHGCYSLVTRGIYRRLPDELREYCLVVDRSSVSSFKEALDNSMEPIPEGDPNGALRDLAFAVLDELLVGQV
jgi:glycosyltransferase involved in cell wall biosynthesis